MKVFLIAVILTLAVAAVYAAPASADHEPIERADRHRRVTCDLLTAGGFINDSACAANCLSMGKAGGSCQGAICVCRTDTFGDLWRKRFGG